MIHKLKQVNTNRPLKFEPIQMHQLQDKIKKKKQITSLNICRHVAQQNGKTIMCLQLWNSFSESSQGTVIELTFHSYDHNLDHFDPFPYL
jgi:hypothetical protein